MSEIVIKLRKTADAVDVTEPTYMNLGGHNVCEEIRKLKTEFRNILRVLADAIEAEAEQSGKKETGT